MIRSTAMTTRLKSGTSFLALSLALQGVAVVAAQAADPQTAQAPAVEEVVVTGSRLTSSGFETPTPVTVVTAETLLQAQPSNITDALKQVPALGATQSPTQTNSGTGAAGNNGQANLNLRNLGTNRNLVLVNGRRIVSSNVNNSVDINTLPQNLVARVDVVTGGASAAYGSDAVAGVVNFVLDTKFVGFKGEIGGGISDYGDLPNWKGSFAWGGSFAGDKLHIVASTQWFRQLGTQVNTYSGRTWWDHPYGLIANTTGSGPTNLVLPNIKSSIGSYGGLITNTILKGTQFLANGQVAKFDYGYSPGSTWQSGGDGAWIPFNLAPYQWRTANFLHGEYDFNDDQELYAEAAYSFADVNDPEQKPINTGAGNQYTIYAGNPFIPASVAAVMAANKITSFTMGRYMLDYPTVRVLTRTRVARELVGLKGKFLGNWNYDVSFSHGETNQLLAQTNLNKARQTYAAADAVTNPLTGQVVCRSQFYDTAGNFVPGGTGLDPGCKPQNLFGTNTIDPSTMAWTIGDSWKRWLLKQNVVAATVTGDLGDFRTDAGPVSVATGVEWRNEDGHATTDPISVQNIDFTGIRGGPAALNGRLGPFRFANFQPFGGSYNVKEIFGEVGVPLLKGRTAVEALNVDFAARATDYSTSGTVATWKAGADWQIIPDIRVRGTISRDIRAPNLLELYNGATFNSQNQFYPSSLGGGTTTTVVQITSGNANLTPEKALTKTIGTVLTPTFMDGLQVSVDYYNITIKDAIQTVGSQQTLDNCYLNIPGFCALINVVGGVPQIKTPFLNAAEVKNAGFDFAADYRTQLFDNPLQLALTAQRLTAAYVQPKGGAIQPTLGGLNDPHWRVNLSAKYDIGDFGIFVQERYIGPKFVDATKVEGVFVDDNTVQKVIYSDLTLTYNFESMGAKNQLYLTINNLTNQEPPKDVGAPSSFAQPGNRTTYDFVGRYYSLGIRFKY